MVVGSRAATFIAAGLNRAGSMRLLTNGAPQGDLPAGVARRRRERREVAREHLGRRHVRNVARRHLTQHGALVAGEKKQLVADDRAADRAAELVAPQAVVHLLAVGADRGKWLRRVEATIAQELEARRRETRWCPTWSRR